MAQAHPANALGSFHNCGGQRHVLASGFQVADVKGAGENIAVQAVQTVLWQALGFGSDSDLV